MVRQFDYYPKIDPKKSMDQNLVYIVIHCNVPCSEVMNIGSPGVQGFDLWPHDEEFLAAAESGGVDEDAEDVAADDGYGIDEADEGWRKVVDSSMPTIKLQKKYWISWCFIVYNSIICYVYIQFHDQWS